MITGVGFNHEKFYFPCGEMHVRIKDYEHNSRVSILLEFRATDEVFELLLIADACKRAGLTVEGLRIHYVPFGRQDRVAVDGDCLSIKVFADLINTIGAKEVYIVDPHSEVTTALINNVKVRPQHDVFAQYFKGIKEFHLISPDAGALKKIYKLAQLVNPMDVIECSKMRDPKDGKITGVYVDADHLGGYDCYIVDDICDGGKTFVEIAKELKRKKAGKIVLMVTHGFFTKGIEVFDGLIDEIYTLKGRVK